MDIEKRRIPTRFRLPLIPLMQLMAVKLPKTVKGDGRFVGCLTGWALSVLGIPGNILFETDDPISAVQQAGLSTAGVGFLKDVAKLNDSKQLQKAFAALKAGIESNRTTLDNTFGAAQVASLYNQVVTVLDEYAATNNPPARR